MNSLSTMLKKTTQNGSVPLAKSDIEYPPSERALLRAAMIARVHSLKSSSDALMGVIAERVGAEARQDLQSVEELTREQERLIENMQALSQVGK